LTAAAESDDDDWCLCTCTLYQVTAKSNGVVCKCSASNDTASCPDFECEPAWDDQDYAYYDDGNETAVNLMASDDIDGAEDSKSAVVRRTATKPSNNSEEASAAGEGFYRARRFSGKDTAAGEKFSAEDVAFVKDVSKLTSVGYTYVRADSLQLSVCSCDCYLSKNMSKAACDCYGDSCESWTCNLVEPQRGMCTFTFILINHQSIDQSIEFLSTNVTTLRSAELMA